MLGLKYIIITVTSNINLVTGTTEISVLGINPNLDWIDPKDQTLKSKWMYFITRRSAEKMIEKMKANILYKDLYLISYGVQY